MTHFISPGSIRKNSHSKTCTKMLKSLRIGYCGSRIRQNVYKGLEEEIKAKHFLSEKNTKCADE
jgi:hypothetical protein